MATQSAPPSYRYNPATQRYELLTPTPEPTTVTQQDTLSSLQGDSEGGFSPYRQIPGQDYGEYASRDGEGNPVLNPQSQSTGGLRSLPQYRFDPVRQRYTLLDSTQQPTSTYLYNPATKTFNPPNPTQQNAATQQKPAILDGGGDAGSSGTGSSGTGSGGAVGDVGLGLMGLSESVPGIATSALGVVGQAMADAAINSQAETDAALAQANQQAQEATVSQSAFGPTVSTTTSISPVADPAQVSVSSIGPAESTTSIGEAVDAAEAAAAAADAADAAATGDSDGDSGDGDGGGDGGDGGGDGGGGDGERAGGIISVMNRYAQGGMPDIAQHVQSQGRGEDKLLVHMTPREVEGLQYLAMRHGGSLTINPNTGLVEAGFLSRILPMIAGAALSATGIGAPMAALMVGGATGLATGSLQKGLLAGLGAFGGAGLAGGFGAAGAANAAPVAEATAANLGEAAAAAGPGFPGFNPGVDQFIQTPPPVPPAGPATTFEFGSPAPAAATPAPTFGQNLQQMGRGAANVLGTGPESAAARNAFMANIGGAKGLALTGGAALTSLTDTEPPAPPVSQSRIRPYRYNPNRQTVSATPAAGAERVYFRPSFSPVGVFKPGEEPTSYALGGGINMGGSIHPDYNQNVDRNSGFSDDYYGGGLTALSSGGSANKPRFLVGKGDGMSDSIPATINNVQPARLADGEFVVPADVVSHLGNGSSKAGAAKLHTMMDRIRKVRTGKKQQAPEVKAERYMPA